MLRVNKIFNQTFERVIYALHYKHRLGIVYIGTLLYLQLIPDQLLLIVY